MNIHPAHFSLSKNALHLFDNEDFEFLQLRLDGVCRVRSMTRDGSLHTHTQSHPGLLAWLVKSSGTHFAVEIQPLPAAIAAHFPISSIIALIPSMDTEQRILIARERLKLEQVELLRAHLEPFEALLHEDRIISGGAMLVVTPEEK
jgi:hypothetical protein